MVNFLKDRQMLMLFGGVVALLIVATTVGQLLRLRAKSDSARATIANLNARINAWWVMSFVFTLSLLTGGLGSVILFAFLSFWALREFITLTPTRPGDHRALFWVFFAFTPAQFVMVGLQLYEVYSVLIPVYAFLFILARVAFSGDYKRFLERTAKIQAGLMICVYCLSFAPALLFLDLHRSGHVADGANFRLLFFFILMVQFSDALQYLWSKMVGRTVIAPTVSPSKTWEGFLGGTASATLLGAALWWATPFE